MFPHVFLTCAYIGRGQPLIGVHYCQPKLCLTQKSISNMAHVILLPEATKACAQDVLAHCSHSWADSGLFGLMTCHVQMVRAITGPTGSSMVLLMVPPPDHPWSPPMVSLCYIWSPFCSHKYVNLFELNIKRNIQKITYELRNISVPYFSRQSMH